LGSLILISVIIPASIKPQYKFLSPVYGLVSRLKNRMAELFAAKSLASLFSIGLLNGLLPCGFVYLAIAAAIASGSAANGALFMAAFGIGTVPVMMMISWFAHLATMKFRSNLSKLFPYVISLMAILMILRGLNLGIPYVSPKMSAVSPSEVSCHTETKICCHK
jgi:sulfite exporter TauE/SafE